MCQNCEYNSPKYLGRCPNCGSWSSFVEELRPGTKMKIVFVRHGEPDYSMLDKLENPRLYSGFGRDLAPLTGKGRSLAKEVAKTACFGKAEIIISSSVTRALETAHYIAVETGLDLFVEPFFHE